MSAQRHQLMRASAGTGKTYQLVQAYVRAVLGGLAPSQIVAITFTRKAAMELRSRVRAALLVGHVRAALVAQGRLGSTLADLGRAPIANFHVLALQLLQQFAPPTDFPEGTEVMGEPLEDQTLFAQAAEDAWFAGNDDVAAAVRQLSMHFSLDDLALDLWQGVSRAREDGSVINAKTLLGHYDCAALQKKVHHQLLEVRERLRAEQSTLSGKGQASAEAFLRRGAVDASLPVFAWQQAWLAAVRTLDLRTKIRSVVPTNERNELLAAIEQVAAEALCAELVQPLAVVLEAAWANYEAIKVRQRRLDFADLVARAVALLEGSAAVHGALQKRLAAVLVDEAQDTNGLQRRFVDLLAGFSGPAASLGSQPSAWVFVVGDWKQSIYTFRGADPESFAHISDSILAREGEASSLSVSRRSNASVVRAINHLGEHLFGERYEPLEALNPADTDGSPGFRWLELDAALPDDGRTTQREAEAVADYVLKRLGQGKAVGDFVVLLSAMTHAQSFAKELGNRGIPAVLGGGGGLYAQEEIADMLALVGFLSNADDGLHAAVALRSPLFGWSDNALLRLFGAGSRHDARNHLAALGRGQWQPQPALSAADQAVVAHTQEILPVLKKAAGTMAVGELLELADTLLHWRAVYLALSHGEQRLANLDRLVGMAHDFDRRQRGGLVAFARAQLTRLANNFNEPLSSVMAAERRAVLIGTVHQAKGLEFPNVLLPGLGRRARSEHSKVRYSKEHGLVFAPLLERQALQSQRFADAAQRAKDWEEAERQRLLYVAVTRAKEEVVFVSHPEPRSSKHGFLGLLWDWRQGAVAAKVLAIEPAPSTALEPEMHDADGGDAQELTSWAQDIVQRSGLRHSPAGSRFTLSVTQLEVFSQCTRRGLFTYEMGLPEAPAASNSRQSPGFAADASHDGALDPLSSGRLAHAVLALMDRYKNFEDPSKFVADALECLGYDNDDERVINVRHDVVTFLQSPFGRLLTSLPNAKRRHEMPFEMTVPAGPHSLTLVGQIDLLYEDAQGPVVVDYKYAKTGPKGIEPYTRQLDAYAAAVARLCGIGAGVRTRLVFLREPESSFERFVSPQMADQLLTQARRVVDDLAHLEERARLSAPLQATTCEKLACGFVGLCHGSVPPQSGSAVGVRANTATGQLQLPGLV